MYIWKIIIRYAGTRKVLRIKGKPYQPNLEVYEKAKAFAKKLVDEDTDKVMSIDLVCGTRAYAPKEGTKIPRNHLWCPYCVKPRAFADDPELGVKKCPVCGISDNDFYVKKHNGIFKEEYNDYLLSLKPRKEGV
jgi:hypothetical protein